MDAFPYAPFIEAFPEIDTPIDGFRGWLLAGPLGQAAFFRADKDVVIPEHAHLAQWGIVVTGRLELTVNGETRVYGPGDTYRAGRGEPHAARLEAGTCIIDVFEEQRFRAREAARGV